MLPVGAGRMSKIPLVPPPQPESCRRSPPLFQPADKTLHGECSAVLAQQQRAFAVINGPGQNASATTSVEAPKYLN